MILYIKALGFSAFDTREKAEALVSEVLKTPTKRYITNYKSDKIRVEYYKEYGSHFGLMARGEMDDNEELKVHSLLPYAVGTELTDTHEVDVVQGEKSDIFSAYCEESKSGTPISFFLQNVIDYLEIDEEEEIYIEGVRLSAFSIEGTVVLPIEKDEEDLSLEAEEDKIREELLEQARQGNEDAMEMLEEEAEEASQMLHERMMSEDILSILEGFFVPLGDDEDIYSILGTIEGVKAVLNRVTLEEIYMLKVKCMNLNIDVYIHKEDVVGQPMVGMRYKGTCWIHGIIEFDEEDLEDQDDELNADTLSHLNLELEDYLEAEDETDFEDEDEEDSEEDINEESDEDSDKE